MKNCVKVFGRLGESLLPHNHFGLRAVIEPLVGWLLGSQHNKAATLRMSGCNNSRAAFGKTFYN